MESTPALFLATFGYLLGVETAGALMEVVAYPFASVPRAEIATMARTMMRSKHEPRAQREKMPDQTGTTASDLLASYAGAYGRAAERADNPEKAADLNREADKLMQAAREEQVAAVNSTRSCPTCGGSGVVVASAAAMRGAPMGTPAAGPCSVCKGTGRVRAG